MHRHESETEVALLAADGDALVRTREAGRARGLLALPWATTAARLVLGVVMLWAGLTKVTDLRASNAAVAAYGLVSPESARIIGGALPFAEIALGILLLAGVATRLAAVVSAVAMGAYIAAIASAWARGLSIDCGCFGGGGPVTHGAQQAYAVDIARDTALLAVAVFLAWLPRSRYALDGWLFPAETSKPAPGKLVAGEPATRKLAATQPGEWRGAQLPGSRGADAAVHAMVVGRRRRHRGRLVALAAALAVAAASVAGIGAIEASASVPAVPARVPVGTTADKAGLALSPGPVRVDVYLDYLCPECKIAETSFAPLIARLEREHKITLVYHPIGFLDQYSSPAGYSSRAAAAAGCAADQGRLAQYTQVLYRRQPPEHGPGLSTQQLIAAGQAAGITSPGFGACVRAGTYAPWVTYVSDVAFGKDVAVTPTVFVNGQLVDVSDGGNPGAELAQAVAAQK